MTYFRNIRKSIVNYTIHATSSLTCVEKIFYLNVFFFKINLLISSVVVLYVIQMFAGFGRNTKLLPRLPYGKMFWNLHGGNQIKYCDYELMDGSISGS